MEVLSSVTGVGGDSLMASVLHGLHTLLFEIDI